MALVKTTFRMSSHFNELEEVTKHHEGEHGLEEKKGWL